MFSMILFVLESTKYISLSLDKDAELNLSRPTIIILLRNNGGHRKCFRGEEK